MITLRLDPELEHSINNTAKNLGLSKSELIRISIKEFLSRAKNVDSWKAGKDLFGKHSSGYDNLSSDRKKLIREKIKAKRT